MSQTIEIPDFKNEPLFDFSKEEIRRDINNTLEGAESIFGFRFPAIISGIDTYGVDISFKTRNPADIDQVIGNFYGTTEKDVDNAISVILGSREVSEWAQSSMKERAPYLKKIANNFREMRHFLTALVVYEEGKIRTEADADVCEAIDFLEYYSEYGPFLEELNNKTLLNFPGQRNEARYLPGSPVPIFVSIQPWNFPVAISVGPTCAALLAGYSVIYKPSVYSSVVGYYIAKCIYDSGIPPDVFHFLPGSGRVVGKYLIDHPRVTGVAFTGSTDVGSSIEKSVFDFNREHIKSLSPALRFKKKVAALETGGKNAIIVDSDADVDQAVVGVYKSSFGYSGQKCSACSRLIIVDSGTRLYDAVLSRLSERIADTKIGMPKDEATQMGPLINKSAVNNFYSYLNLAEAEGGRILVRGNVPAYLNGYFVEPVIVANVGANSRFAQEEIFAPALAVFKVSTFGDALMLANNTEFGLTGGVYSRNPVNIQMAKKYFNVGNLYINQKCTGAIVGRQPFGGFKMSGNGTKAGGWDYLLNFLYRKNISEDTMRHGAVLE